MSQAMQHVVVDSNPGMSVGVQTWSRGDIFPAVIAVVETYRAPVGFARYQKINSWWGKDDLARRMYDAYLGVFYSQSLAERLISRRYSLQYPGRPDSLYDTYEGAGFVARSYIAADML